MAEYELALYKSMHLFILKAMQSRAVVKPVAHGNWLHFIAERGQAVLMI